MVATRDGRIRGAITRGASSQGLRTPFMCLLFSPTPRDSLDIGARGPIQRLTSLSAKASERARQPPTYQTAHKRASTPENFLTIE